MELYVIKGFPEYRITETAIVYGVLHRHLERLEPTESGGYVLYNEYGRHHLRVKRLMKLADLPYDKSMYLPKTYVTKTKKEVDTRRYLEERLRRKEEECPW